MDNENYTGTGEKIKTTKTQDSAGLHIIRKIRKSHVFRAWMLIMPNIGRTS